MLARVQSGAAMSEADETHWEKCDTELISVNDIQIIDRIVYPTKARIDAMAKSLSGPLGQIEPILITKHNSSSLKVVAGATRLLAAKQLGWKRIEATTIAADNSFEYQLIEIEENLGRHDLGDDERQLLKAKRKEVMAKRWLISMRSCITLHILAASPISRRLRRPREGAARKVALPMQRARLACPGQQHSGTSPRKLNLPKPKGGQVYQRPRSPPARAQPSRKIFGLQLSIASRRCRRWPLTRSNFSKSSVRTRSPRQRLTRPSCRKLPASQKRLSLIGQSSSCFVMKP